MKIVKNVVRTLVLSALALVAILNSQMPEKQDALQVETVSTTKAITAMSAAVVADEVAN